MDVASLVTSVLFLVFAATVIQLVILARELVRLIQRSEDRK